MIVIHNMQRLSNNNCFSVTLQTQSFPIIFSSEQSFFKSFSNYKTFFIKRNRVTLNLEMRFVVIALILRDLPPRSLLEIYSFVIPNTKNHLVSLALLQHTDFLVLSWALSQVMSPHCILHESRFIFIPLIAVCCFMLYFIQLDLHTILLIFMQLQNLYGLV